METKTVARELVRIIPLFLRNVGPDLRCLDAGLSPSHFRVLHTLYRQSYHLGDLAEQQGVTQATMSNTVTMLVERGWVQRSACAEDRRKVFVQITPAGEAMLFAIVRVLEERLTAVLADLSAEELEHAYHGLVILRQAILDHTEGGYCAMEGKLAETIRLSYLQSER